MFVNQRTRDEWNDHMTKLRENRSEELSSLFPTSIFPMTITRSIKYLRGRTTYLNARLLALRERDFWCRLSLTR